MLLFDRNLVLGKIDCVEIFPSSGGVAVFLLGYHFAGRAPGIFGKSSGTPALFKSIKQVDF
jgi:hypothetical protein